ncbi:peptidylprolyl isomerase [Leptolyngbya sp. FACHB-36]|uniref:FKBP-type peptidyl-prolyl cis-trans isomerase n=1 Tax=Leptolyngbya sp. FACHB-36 TaxID=2692808 RepID=UPI00168071E5|nr:peptidylprolyl isomerase [Leptolyngbya sp. FACHB-36]MBD2021198.1 peptidylprolyl isomerase [Leptolyngbya sp. FACHB-36]
MSQAKQGDTVKVHYTGKLDDGTVFDSSTSGDPLQFTIGEGMIIPGFEQAVLGMAPGDSKTELIPTDQAYGPHQEEMVVVIDRQQMPAEIEPEIGQQLQIQQPTGQVIPVIITDVSGSAVTLDANHPLAGEDLTFDIELVEIV